MELIDDHKEIVLLAAFVLWLVARGRSDRAWVRYIGPLLGLGFAIEMAGKWLGHQGLNNHLLYNAFFLLDFGVISWMLYRSFPGAPGLHRLLAGAGIMLLPTLLWDLWSNGTPYLLATKTLIIGGFLLGLLAVIALFELVRESAVPVHRHPLFWILLSIMVYYLSFIPIFGLYNYLVANHSQIVFEVNKVNSVLFLTRYGLVLVGLVLLYRQAPASHGGQ
ncbi:MAG TPA: hypothetical protein PKJ19_08755 [Flavobacteriales bacterium]|nr:hypothetical protein [Flavobacteriales bacterium]HNU57637.1 hypothetical protein [Flavobacteriales bacterium]